MPIERGSASAKHDRERPIAEGGYDPDLFDRLVEIEERSFWFRGRNRLIVELVRGLSAPGERFLEVGCGTGYVLQALARECGLQATGTELFAEGLVHARRRLPEAELVQLDAREMQFDGDFDLAGSFDVIEHIDDDLAVLRGMRQAVRPGGFVLLTVPQHPWLWGPADMHAQHLRRYRRAQLVARMQAAELAPLLVTSFVSSLLPIMALARWRDRRTRSDFDALSGLVLPTPVSRLFELLLDGERWLIRHGVRLPAGGSLVAVARR